MMSEEPKKKSKERQNALADQPSIKGWIKRHEPPPCSRGEKNSTSGMTGSSSNPLMVFEAEGGSENQRERYSRGNGGDRPKGLSHTDIQRGDWPMKKLTYKIKFGGGGGGFGVL